MTTVAATVCRDTAVPSATEQKATKFAFKASDDYGVASARAALRRYPGPSLGAASRNSGISSMSTTKAGL